MWSPWFGFTIRFWTICIAAIAFISEGEIRIVALRTSPISCLLRFFTSLVKFSFKFSTTISRAICFTAITFFPEGKIRIIAFRAIPVSTFFVIISSTSVIAPVVSFRVPISSTTTILAPLSWSDFNRRTDCV